MTTFRAWSGAAAWWLLAVAVCPACADLSKAEPGACGNGVIEEGEECDKHAEFPGSTCGAPGTPAQCRYLCAYGAASTGCPAGRGCGQDGICRQPSRTFTELTAAAAEGASRIILPADFDGDGRPTLILMADDDALGRRVARIVDPDAETSGSGAQVPAPMAAPAVADLDGDSRADVAFADVRGVAVLRGNSQHQADFISYPTALLPDATRSRAVVFDVLRGASGVSDGDEIMAFLDRGSGGATLEQFADATVPSTLVGLPAGVSDLAGRIVWARFNEGPDACDSIVFPFQGQASVFVFAPCRGGAWNVQDAPDAIGLPEGVTVSGPVLLADLDHDGHKDLVINATLAGTADAPEGVPGTYAAYGVGDGTFRSGAGALGQASAHPFLGDELTPEGDAHVALFPLALDRLNGDDALDFAAPDGIYVSQAGSPYYHLQTPNFAADWDEAVIEDLNGDGRLDVVGVSSKELDLQFLNNAGDGLFNVSSVPTGGPPSNVVVGDFDGDLVSDVAFSEKNSSLGDGWSIAFGAPRGSPAVVRRMGRLPQIQQLVAARLLDPTTGLDGISDLLLISSVSSGDAAPATSSDRLVVSLGRGERVMLAPLALQDTSSTELPVAITTGRFTDPSKISILSVAHDRSDDALASDQVKPLHLWLTDPSGGDRSTSTELPASFYRDDVGFRYGIHLAAGDLDVSAPGATKIDEAVIIGPYASQDGPDGSTVYRSALVVARYNPTSQRFDLGAPQLFPYQSTLYSPLTLADVDGDGALDIIYKPSDDSPSPILVFWNDRNGGFDVSQPAILDSPDSDTSGQGLYAFTCVRVDGACRLHVVSPRRAFSVAFDAGRQPTLQPIPELPGGLAIASGDFDGDGLDDLAIGNDSGMRAFHSEPILK
jgi:hypothetical protein